MNDNLSETESQKHSLLLITVQPHSPVAAFDSPRWGVWALGQVTSLLARGLEHLEGAHQVLVDRHHRRAVVELAAVVGRGEDRHELPLREELVAVLDDLSESTLCQP